MKSGRNTVLVLWFFFYSGVRYSAYLLTYLQYSAPYLYLRVAAEKWTWVGFGFRVRFWCKELVAKSKISSSIFTELREFRAIFCCRPEAKYIKSLQL